LDNHSPQKVKYRNIKSSKVDYKKGVINRTMEKKLIENFSIRENRNDTGALWENFWIFRQGYPNSNL
jgi:hypothetical protein